MRCRQRGCKHADRLRRSSGGDIVRLTHFGRASHRPSTPAHCPFGRLRSRTSAKGEQAIDHLSRGGVRDSKMIYSPEFPIPPPLQPCTGDTRTFPSADLQVLTKGSATHIVARILIATSSCGSADAPSPDDFPAPGEAAARVTDADLVGCKLGQCQSAADRYRLSPRERDILFLSLCDLRPGEIAARL